MIINISHLSHNSLITVLPEMFATTIFCNLIYCFSNTVNILFLLFSFFTFNFSFLHSFSPQYSSFFTFYSLFFTFHFSFLHSISPKYSSFFTFYFFLFYLSFLTFSVIYCHTPLTVFNLPPFVHLIFLYRSASILNLFYVNFYPGSFICVCFINPFK